LKNRIDFENSRCNFGAFSIPDKPFQKHLTFAFYPSANPFSIMKKFLQFAIGLVISAGLSACATKKSAEYAGVDSDYVLGTPLPDRVDGASFFGENVTRGQYPPIYFAFDSYSISSVEMAKVQSLASAMRNFKNSIIIAGFTDERGTDEYNRGLGERRAQAVRNALIALGIDGNRIQTVSFGKEMPADPASNEEAWAKNRRAEIGIIR
jgi:peptidoglycan-associated lipoprotein